MNLLCPACHAALPAAADAVVTCPDCSAEVDVARAGTVAGRPRFVPELDRTGSTVGGYRIEARLGGGGMGTVYRATDAGGQPVALKFLSSTLASNADTVARFAREITTLARLEHPAIVRVLGHGNEGGIPWFAMELVEGSDLGSRLAQGALAPAETAAVFGRLFAALGHAHQRGVVHRDLKPANVLLAPEGARLADFGIARWEAEALSGAGAAVTRLTETAAVIGTLPYMSPEQRRGRPVDRRSDLFSAGVMLYEAATGTLPLGAFAPPSEVDPRYGRRFDRVVLELLQPEPDRRPDSAEAVAEALAAALPTPRRRRRQRLALGAAAGALGVTLLAGGFGGRALLQRGPDKEKLAPNEIARPKVNLPAAPLATTPGETAVAAPPAAPAAPATTADDDVPGADPVRAAPKEKTRARLWKKQVLPFDLATDEKAPAKAPLPGTIGLGNLGTIGKEGKPARTEKIRGTGKIGKASKRAASASAPGPTDLALDGPPPEAPPARDASDQAPADDVPLTPAEIKAALRDGKLTRAEVKTLLTGDGDGSPPGELKLKVARIRAEARRAGRLEQVEPEIKAAVPPPPKRFPEDKAGTARRKTKD